MQDAAAAKALQRVVLPMHDVPLEELARKLRSVWAACGGDQDATALKQVHPTC